MIPTFDIRKMSKNVERFEKALMRRRAERERLLSSFSFTVVEPGVIQVNVFLDTRILKTYIDTLSIKGKKVIGANTLFKGFIKQIKDDLRQIYYQENPKPQLSMSDFSESDDEWLVTSNYEESVENWRNAFDYAWNRGETVPVPLGKRLQVMHTEISKGMSIRTSANIAEITQMYLNEITGVTIGDLSTDNIFLIVKSLFSPSDSLPGIPISLKVKDTENINAKNLKEKVIPGEPSITINHNEGKVYIGNDNLFYILL